MTDPARALARALVRSAGVTGCAVLVEDHHTVPWMAATFDGTQHHLSLTGPTGAAFDRWLAGLDEEAFTLPGHVVASIDAAALDRSEAATVVRLGALTIVAD